MASSPIRYLLFDIESVTDGQLISKIRFPNEDLSPGEATARYQIELKERTGSEFVPYTYHLPIAVAIIKIRQDFRIDDIKTLDDDQYRPHIITKHFWEGWNAYHKPTLISFNGRTFDIPLMELAAYRYGISIPGWFNQADRSYEQKRNRFNQNSHIDLQEVITNFGATRLNGGLNLMANILGKPGTVSYTHLTLPTIYSV